MLPATSSIIHSSREEAISYVLCFLWSCFWFVSTRVSNSAANVCGAVATRSSLALTMWIFLVAPQILYTLRLLCYLSLCVCVEVPRNGKTM
ncbi:hypothetical protein EDB85DRAFT_1948288 [Lactarius pseudohatsudake]|nr:hypothetical protein EDB85DRAFT_1948288 [Lactarius pseudohatsudake]